MRLIEFCKKNPFLVLAILIFLALTLPFIHILPYLDGNIEFVQTYNYFHGGLKEYFASWHSVHPPFKIIFASIFYSLFGINQFSYTLPGLLIGVSAVICTYLFIKNLFGKEAAGLSALLLSSSPLFISTSIFMMRDYILTTLVLISLYFYFGKRWFFYALFASFAILAKETGIILSASIFAVEFISVVINRKIQLQKEWQKYIAIALPFVVYNAWNLVLSSSGKSSWNDWIFTSNENKSAIYTIVNNLKTFQFLNPYAYEHWKQLVFLNFNWVSISLITILFFYFMYRKLKSKQFFKEFSEKEKLFIFVFFFSIIYLLTVLSLQTYTIPRYALPLIPFIIISLSVGLTSIKNLVIKRIVIIAVLILTVLSLFSSNDPIAKRIWGTEDVMGKNIYALRYHLAGNDGITYNIEYLQIANIRSNLIIQANASKSPVHINNCYWIFPDPNNEYKMIKILNLNTQLSCIY